MSRAMYDLAAQIARRPTYMRMVFGVVTGWTGGSLTVTIGATYDANGVVTTAGYPIFDVARLDSYSPAVGDDVLLLADDEDYVVIGSLAD